MHHLVLLLNRNYCIHAYKSLTFTFYSWSLLQLCQFDFKVAQRHEHEQRTNENIPTNSSFLLSASNDVTSRQHYPELCSALVHDVTAQLLWRHRSRPSFTSGWRVRIRIIGNTIQFASLEPTVNAVGHWGVVFCFSFRLLVDRGTVVLMASMRNTFEDLKKKRKNRE